MSKSSQKSFTLDKMREIRKVSEKYSSRNSEKLFWSEKEEGRGRQFEEASENSSEMQVEGGEVESTGVKKEDEKKETSWYGGMYIWGDDQYGGDEEEVENTHWVAANFKREKKDPDEEEKTNIKTKNKMIKV